MTRLEYAESTVPSLCTSLRALNECTASLKNCQAMHSLRQAKEFFQSRTLVSLFLAIFIVLGCLPFIILAAFISSSFLMVFLGAVTVFGGTFLAACFSFLVVLFPIFILGAPVAIFVYLSYRFAVITLRMIKQLRDTISSLISRFLPVSVSYGENLKVKTQHVLTPQNEERTRRRLLNSQRRIESRTNSFNKLKLD